VREPVETSTVDPAVRYEESTASALPAPSNVAPDTSSTLTPWSPVTVPVRVARSTTRAVYSSTP